ncbi:MAG: hypothetical protein U9R05_05200 [Chloroflexota bacterium]|nr:hypothetical protein [Chloroflexota bacterium]
MDIEFLVQRLEKYLLEESPKIPLSGSRVINEEEIRAQLARLRETVPKDIARARDIVKQQDALLAQAQQSAAQIIEDAEQEVQRLVGEHRLMQEARQQSAITRKRAIQEAVSLREDADEYAFNALSQLQGELARLQRVVDNGLQKLEADREQRLDREKR